jgi:hypothetical protein
MILTSFLHFVYGDKDNVYHLHGQGLGDIINPIVELVYVALSPQRYYYKKSYMHLFNVEADGFNFLFLKRHLCGFDERMVVCSSFNFMTLQLLLHLD